MKQMFTRSYLLSLLLILRFCAFSQTITTIAGGGSISGVAATTSPVPYPTDVAFDAAGNQYIVCNGDGSVRKVTPAGIITTVAGGGGGTLIDGGSAIGAPLVNPTSVAVDAAGNLYISEWGGAIASRIRKVNSSGIISTIAGTGVSGYSGDGGAATLAKLNFPTGLCIDAGGNIYFADFLNNRVRKINTSGIISTIAGTGTGGYNGDGITAVSAQLNLPSDLAINAFGNIYIADNGNQRVRVVLTNGVIFTTAGTGAVGFSGDGGSATAAKLNSPWGVSVDAGPNDVYISCQGDHRVRKVTGSTGFISTVAGNGISGFSGDGGPSSAALLNAPWSMVVDGSGSLFVADENNHRVRKVSASGTITTTAGNGVSNAIGDGGPALNAILFNPASISMDRSGNIYFPDHNRVRRLSPSGLVTTIAGSDAAGFAGDGGAATAALLNNPYGVYADASGNVYINSSGDNRIRKINAAGIISTIAGNGTTGYSGDGGAATNAILNGPAGITGDAAGTIYFTDNGNSVVRKINTAGIISTVAGTGVQGYSGDGGPATAATFGYPNAITLDAAGNLFVADDFPNCIRRINTAGIISTIAGGSFTNGTTGDGGVATAALFLDIEGVYVDASGNIYIVDRSNHKIRKVDAATNIISTFAGTGVSGFSGDGGAPGLAQLRLPYAITQDTLGNFIIADAGNKRIRKVSIPYTLATTNVTVSQTINGTSSINVNDNSYHRLATVLPTAGANAISGNVSFRVAFDGNVQTYNGKPYVQRHYDITPTQNASTAQATVKLYFLQSEFDAYNSYVTASNANVPLLPTGGINNGGIIINQYHGTGTAPGNYSGSTVNIIPSVNWNSINNWWEVSFAVNGFSGFYLSTANTPLPLTLINFTGTLHDNSVALNWSTSNESNLKEFTVERSADTAAGFVSLGAVPASNTAGINHYRFTDNNVPLGTSIYRLRIANRDGRNRYSNNVSIKTTGNATNLILYPNPVRDRLYVQLQSSRSQNIRVQITDMKGTILRQQQIQVENGSTGFSINTETLPAGLYLLNCSGENFARKTFIRQ